MAQSAKCLTLDFGSGHDPMVCKMEPHVGLCTGSTKLTQDSLCPYPAGLSFKKQTKNINTCIQLPKDSHLSVFGRIPGLCRFKSSPNDFYVKPA